MKDLIGMDGKDYGHGGNAMFQNTASKPAWADQPREKIIADIKKSAEEIAEMQRFQRENISKLLQGVSTDGLRLFHEEIEKEIARRIADWPFLG